MAGNSKSWSRAPGRGLVVGVFLAVLGLWVASIFVVPWAAKKLHGAAECSVVQQSLDDDCEQQLRSTFGTFGDSFGAINSLFTGLALAGVVLTLFFQSEGARRVVKPFVIPKLRRDDADARISIRAPHRTSASVSLPIRVAVPLHNTGSFPSLNVSAEFAVEGVTKSVTAVTDVPLAAGDSSPCVLDFEVSGEEAKRFVDAVCSAGAKAHLQVRFDSVEGLRWKSQASYLLTVNKGRPDDERLLRDAVDGALAPAHLWTTEETVDLDFSPVPGSWSYAEDV